MDALPHRQESKGVVGGKPEKLFRSAFVVGGAGRLAGKVYKRKGGERYPIERVYADAVSRRSVNMTAINFAVMRYFLIEFHRQATLLQNTKYAKGRL